MIPLLVLLAAAGLYLRFGLKPPAASPAAYRSGVMTYVRLQDGKKTLYALNGDGTSTLLAESAGDLAVLAVSPDHRYLAVAVSFTSTLSPPLRVVPGFTAAEAGDQPVSRGVALWVVSADGKGKNVVVPAADGLDAVYAANGRLVVAVAEGGASRPETVTYYAARSDGSQPGTMHLSRNTYATPTRGVAP